MNKQNVNTELTYLYRDASNYKFFSSIIVSGSLNITDVKDYLFESEYFLPEYVGLKSLVPEQQNEDDHIWHELVEAKETDSLSASLSADDLIRLFKENHADGWKI